MRVVIAEDSVLLRAGLERPLVDGGLEVVGTVGDGPGLIAAVRRVVGGGTALDPEVVAQLLGRRVLAVLTYLRS
jgi:hypothetical protein